MAKTSAAPRHMGVDIAGYEPDGLTCCWSIVNYSKRGRPEEPCGLPASVSLAIDDWERTPAGVLHRKSRLNLPLCRKHVVAMAKSILSYVEE